MIGLSIKFRKMNDNMTNGDLVQQAHANIFTSSILFIWSTMSGFSAVALLSVIAEERISTYREMYDGLYSTTTYVIYKLVEEFIPQIIAGLIYSLMVFYILRLNGSYAIFCLVYFASTAIAMACTLAIGAATPDPVISGSIVLAYVTTWFFFSGFLIPFNDIPVYWQWYSVIDPLRYSFGSMMANQFSDNNPDILAGINVLQFYGLEGVNAWAWLGFEFLFIPVFIVCFWAAMKWVRY